MDAKAGAQERFRGARKKMMIGINSLPAGNHQPEFTAHCITEEADRAVLDGALAMAWTAIEMAGNAALRGRLMKKSDARASA